MRILFTFIILTFSVFCFAQDCPYITGAMINACGTSEGTNEFVTFNTGGNPLTIANFNFSYGSTTPPPFTTSATLWINGGAAGIVLSSQPAGISLTGCPNINVITDVNSSIPAGANVVMMYSSTTLTTFDLTTQCSGGEVYVIFINTANTTAADGFSSGGNFANNPASGSLRYLNITNSAAPCSGENNVVGYSGTAIANWGINADGNAVLWNSSGTPTYVNNGCFSIAMPVDLSNFEVIKKEMSALISFATASETNNDYFTIERSADGKSFESIGEIDGAGNSSREISYEFVDDKPMTGINYYRIKQTDYDGQYSYSEIKSVRFKDIKNISITPRTTEGSLYITTDIDDYTISIFTAAGQEVKSFTSMSLDQNINIEELKAGIYFVRINSGAESETLRIVKI